MDVLTSHPVGRGVPVVESVRVLLKLGVGVRESEGVAVTVIDRDGGTPPHADAFTCVCDTVTSANPPRSVLVDKKPTEYHEYGAFSVNELAPPAMYAVVGKFTVV